MTIQLNLVLVADSISKLSIPGVTIKDVDQIAENTTVLTPILYPRPNGYLSNFRATDGRTFGSMGTEQLTITYDLTYRYLHAPIGGGLGGLFNVYGGLITNVATIAKAILMNDVITGAVDVQLKDVASIGPVSDPAGNVYHGCDLVLHIREYT
jgi:hypothetical protein